MRENLAAAGDQVTINGRSRHVVGYLKDFLFSEKTIHMPVKALSGGERNRLLLARLFTRSFNFLVMDEPTNDLDIETLELLEDLLVDIQGRCYWSAMIVNSSTTRYPARWYSKDRA